MTDSLLIAILVLTAFNTVTLAINAFLRWIIVRDFRAQQTEKSVAWRQTYKVEEKSDG